PNRVYVQMPNTTKVLTAKIREGVNTTLDCGLLIDKITANPLTRNHYTYWTVSIKQYDGSFSADFANVTAGESSAGLEIFGDNDRLLRSANAKQSNIGVFTCHFCYEEFDILTRHSVHSTCTNSSSDINIPNPLFVGTVRINLITGTHTPTIDRNQSSVSDPSVRIGITLCLNTLKDQNTSVSVICSQLGTIIDKPTANFNGNPIVNGVLFAVQDEVLTILPGFYQYQGELTCVLSNHFGNDTETTLLLFDAISNFSDSINGVPDNQCPPNTPSNVICPGNGQQVDLNCGTNFMNSINITSPDSITVTDRNLSFTVGPNDYGTYTCTAFNECNQSPSTVVLQQCTLPDICLVGPQTGGSQTIDNHCFSNIQSMAGAAIDCDVKFNCSNENEDPVTLTQRMWFIDGVLQTTTNSKISIAQPGSYTCVVIHSCGTMRLHLASIPR
uniref:Ig-like domain-containing protein n=1 Tax=Amphimedon queenslandica TaxID=400682 RepID=A0A1X7SRK8_AMPQE